MENVASGFAALLLAACLLAPGAGAAEEFFVSPHGSDQAPGTRDRPLATLEAARDKVRALKLHGGLPEGGVKVYLRAGIYPRHGAFVLGKEDSGTPARPVEYRACPGESAILSGAVALPPDAFRPVTDPAVLRRLSPVGRGVVRQIDLRRLGITDYGRLAQYGHAQPVTVAPLELFFNDEPMPLARYPNKGSLPLGRIIDPGSIPRWGDYHDRGGTFVAPGAPLDRWVGQSDIWLRGTFNSGFDDDNIRVASVDPKRQRITLASPHLYGLAAGKPFQHYIALNILEELDSPGEWYLDREPGLLYFWPPSALAGARITVSLLKEPLLVLEDVSCVAFTHLTIEGGRGMGVYIEGGQGDTIDHCTIRDLGTIGVLMGRGSRQTSPHLTTDDYEGEPVSREIGNLQNQLYKDTVWDRRGGYDHRVTNCHVYNTGSGGIYLSGGSKKELIPGHCLVENCRIHDYNRRNGFLWAGIDVDGCGNRVAHCEIYGSDFQGIYVHGNDHVFEFNYLHDLARDSNDTSAWYMGRDPSDRGTVIRYNFFSRIGGGPDPLVVAVYLDDATCGATIFGNVFYRAGARASVYSNSGSDIAVLNNLFVESPKAAVELNSFPWYVQDKAAPPIGPRQTELIRMYFGPGGIFQRRLTAEVDIRKPPYSTRYPDLRDWMDPLPGGKEWVGMRPRRNVMARNVIVKCGQGLRTEGRYAQFDARANYETAVDPGFEDAKKLNFKLRADSAVFQRVPGFEPIPFEEIGLRGESVGADSAR